MVRAANAYRNWMIQQSLEPTRCEKSIENDIFFAERRLQELKKWQQIISKLITPKNTNRIVSKQSYGDTYRSIVGEIGEHAVDYIRIASSQLLHLADESKIQPLSQKALLEEIKAIVSEYGENNVTFINKVLCVNIGNVTLTDETEEVDLGEFTIGIDLSSPLPLAKVSIFSEDQVSTEAGYVHPHVSEQRLCMGEAEEPAYDAICSGRLHDFFLIFQSTLTTYNEASPFEELSRWYNPNHDGECFCECCERWVSEEVVLICSKCESIRCDECGEGILCRHCGDWICSNCTHQCTECNEEICPSCCDTCANCSDSCCVSCTTECETCGDSVCPACSMECSGCGNIVCNRCADSCYKCDRALCQDCVHECEDCGKYLCGDCINTCSECGDLVCEKCSNVCCDGCGRNMCNECFEQDNGCLLEGKTVE